MNDQADTAHIIESIPLKSLGLKSGMALQTRRLVEGGSKKESQYFGCIEGKGVMVGPLGPDGGSTGLTPGEVCIVRGFTGVYEFSFLSKVLQTFQKPFVYALLSYPDHADARRVRQSMRTRLTWPCSIILPGQDQQDGVAGSLIDLSEYGAMVQTLESPGAIGTPLRISMKVQVDHVSLQLYLQATICHSHPISGNSVYATGMVFNGQTTHDRVVLLKLTQNH